MTTAAQPISDDALARLRAIITSATAAGHHDIAAEAAEWLDRATRQNAALAAARDPGQPATRARARDMGSEPVDGLSRTRKLRKGRTRCSATRRDGQPCQAPAIKGGSVCRVHGGSTRLAQIAAGLQVRQLAFVDAVEAWQETGTFDALCRMMAAQRDLDAYEAKLDWLRVLRRAARANNAGGDEPARVIPPGG